MGNKPLTAFSQNEERRLRCWLGHGWITSWQRPPQQTLYRKSWLQERTRLTKNKLERRNQERFGERWDLPGIRSSISSSHQTRMTSKCGSMHPTGCGMNQGQGQGQCSSDYVIRRLLLEKNEYVNLIIITIIIPEFL